MLPTVIGILCDNYLIRNCNCQEGSGSEAIRIVNRQCRNEIQNDCLSARYLKSGNSDLKALVLDNGQRV